MKHKRKSSTSSSSSSSQRQFAQESHIPRTTLQHWAHRQLRLQQQTPAALFFETPDGLDVLHRITLAAQFVITQLSGGSIRDFAHFLQLSQLDPFVASSVGTAYKTTIEMEQAICDFGQEQKNTLAQKMPHKNIVIAEDETFHPEICLVTIEPESGFTLLEQYAKDRKAVTWDMAMQGALKGLNVTIIQSVTDGACALQSHVEKGLDVHHAPDLFHVQHELCKATSFPLSSKQKKAEKALVKAKSEEKEEAQKEVERFEGYRKKVRDGLKNISQAYNPVSPQTGRLKEPEELEQELDEQIQGFEKIAEEVDLSESSKERIQKAKRVLPKMVATLAFYMNMLKLRVEGFNLSSEWKALFFRSLFAGVYMEKIAKVQRFSEGRKMLQARSDDLLEEWREKEMELDKGLSTRLEQAARAWASLFVRVSSCVEGRNGQLEKHKRNSRRLSKRKLEALTVLHNFHIKREDGTTAAQRFFENEHDDLFEHLVKVLEYPKRPATRRRKIEA